MAKDEELLRPEKPAFSEGFDAGVISLKRGWLKDVWNKWPGDETIEELLDALDDGNGAGGTICNGEKC